MESISKSSLPGFLSRRPYSIVHVDGIWDGCRMVLAKKIIALQPRFEPEVSFGYMDCDADREHWEAIGLRNVPSVAYYRGSTLVGLVVGMQQDIAGNIGRMKRGEALDQTNLLSQG